MKSYLTRAWEALTARLGSVASFLLPLAKELDVAIRAQDVAKVERACTAYEVRAREVREALEAGDQLVTHLRASMADGRLSAVEAGQGLLLVERLVDESEDVATGRDEDDTPATP